MSNRSESFWLIAAALVIADQIIKYLSSLLNHPVSVGNVEVGRVLNVDGFYGLRLANSTLIIIGALICVALIALIIRDHVRSTVQLGYWLLLGGAFSNLVDRIRVGGVVDIIGWQNVTHFNLADVMIVLGALAMIETLWKRDERRND